jgi:putative hydrolase of the HAD superfamily
LIVLDEDGYRRRAEVFAEARSLFGLTDPVEDLLADYRREYVLSYVKEEEVLVGLTRLREAGWKIGIVTNGPATQTDKIAITGLAELLDACCVSEVIGAAKPDPFVFHTAARLAGCELDGWMVGDNPEADIGGAHAVGLKTIWIARGRAWDRSDFAPTETCETILEALDLLLALKTIRH